MDRELVLCVLAILLVGIAVLAGGLWALIFPVNNQLHSSGRTLERIAFRRVLAPLTLILPALGILMGWALVEPAQAEHVPVGFFAIALPVVLIWLRAAVRGYRAAQVPTIRSAATIGLVHPRVIVGEELVAQLDTQALNAAIAHEQAHARHRDPLRIWLAQIATDVQWPLPGAGQRFTHWLFTLELARDEEARECNDGADLAAAVLVATRIEQKSSFACAGIASASDQMRLRVARLLTPLDTTAKNQKNLKTYFVLISLTIMCALFLGARFGEFLIGSGLRWVR